MKAVTRIITLIACTFGGSLQANTTAALSGQLADDISGLQADWAHIQYQTQGKDSRIKALFQLEQQASDVVDRHPERAEPLIWSSIIIATRAAEDGGIGALPLVRRARTQLETAIDIDETALDGSAHVSLGSLYYQVPPWPLAFGSNKKARRHLTRALEVNPDNIDANYFYGGYLEKLGKYQEAANAYAKALTAAPRPGRELADEGRRLEIETAMKRIARRLSADENALVSNSR